VREPETGVEKVKRKWLQRTGPQVDILVIAPKTVGERIKEGLSKTFPIDKWEVNLDECDRIERARRINSKVALQVGALVVLANIECVSEERGNMSVLDWKSRAGDVLTKPVSGKRLYFHWVENAD
ncbi:hypothetical protein AK812_SmicGene47244, partial [Symbiodinium microadriaticum]